MLSQPLHHCFRGDITLIFRLRHCWQAELVICPLRTVQRRVSLEPSCVIVREESVSNSSKSSGCENFPRCGMGRIFATSAPCVSFIRLLYPQAICIALTTWDGFRGGSCEVDADGMCGIRIIVDAKPLSGVAHLRTTVRRGLIETQTSHVLHKRRRLTNL